LEVKLQLSSGLEKVFFPKAKRIVRSPFPQQTHYFDILRGDGINERTGIMGEKIPFAAFVQHIPDGHLHLPRG
jgi:hypothetical protein